MAHEDPRYKDILESTKTVIFLGTPHNGSKMAAIGSALSGVIYLLGSISLLNCFLGRTRSDLVKMLKSWSPELGRISDSFRHRVKNMDVVSFYETMAYSLLNQEVS